MLRNQLINECDDELGNVIDLSKTMFGAFVSHAIDANRFVSSSSCNQFELDAMQRRRSIKQFKTIKLLRARFQLDIKRLICIDTISMQRATGF